MTTRTLPYSWYIDSHIYDREQARVFGRYWQYAGHTGQLPIEGGVNALAPTRVGNVPILLVRTDSGELRGFLNACRHRGSELISAEMCRSTIQCPYHAWTYDLDGRLLTAPRSDTEDNFDHDSLGLIPVAVDCWGPFIFANLDPDCTPLKEALGMLPEWVASAGVNVNELYFHSRAESSYAANWKICSENYLECYHCQVAHPGVVDVIDTSEESYRLESRGLCSAQFGPVREGWKGPFDPTGPVGYGQFHFMYPNLTLNISPGFPNISIGPVLPDAPDRSSRYLDYFFGPEADSGWIEDMLAWDNQIGMEDGALVEGVQRGVQAGALDDGVLLAAEQLIVHFDELLRGDLA